jgi:hypothetical protein
MSEKTCLNCGEIVAREFCAACGQAIATERFTFRYLLTKDLAKVVVKVDGGILFTLKLLFTKPGHAVRDYLGGKRVGVTGATTLLFLLASFDAYLRTLWGFELSEGMTTESGRSLSHAIEDARVNHAQMFFLGFLPLRAAISYVFFRRAGLRYAEHLVLDAYGTAAGLAISLVTSALIAIGRVKVGTANAIVEVAGLATMVYFAFLYYQCFSTSSYSKGSLAARSIGAPVMLLVSLMLLAVAADFVHTR